MAWELEDTRDTRSEIVDPYGDRPEIGGCTGPVDPLDPLSVSTFTPLSKRI